MVVSIAFIKCGKGTAFKVPLDLFFRIEVIGGDEGHGLDDNFG
jgi:hypothetical protein